MSGTCSLLLPFGDPWPSCLLPSHFQWIFRVNSFRIDWFDLLAVQGALKSLLQHHTLKASVLWCSAFIIVQLLHLYMTTRKTIAWIRWTFVSKVMSLLFNILYRFVMPSLPRGKCLLVSLLQSPSAKSPHFLLACWILVSWDWTPAALQWKLDPWTSRDVQKPLFLLSLKRK